MLGCKPPIGGATTPRCGGGFMTFSGTCTDIVPGGLPFGGLPLSSRSPCAKWQAAPKLQLPCSHRLQYVVLYKCAFVGFIPGGNIPVDTSGGRAPGGARASCRRIS